MIHAQRTVVNNIEKFAAQTFFITISPRLLEKRQNCSCVTFASQCVRLVVGIPHDGLSKRKRSERGGGGGGGMMKRRRRRESVYLRIEKRPRRAYSVTSGASRRRDVETRFRFVLQRFAMRRDAMRRDATRRVAGSSWRGRQGDLIEN